MLSLGTRAVSNVKHSARIDLMDDTDVLDDINPIVI